MGRDDEFKRGIVSDNKSDIWRLQAQLDTKGLIEALTNTDPGIRKRAAIALRALDATGAVPALTAALAQEQNPEVRSYLVTALEQLAETQDENPTAEKPSEPNRLTALIAQLSSKLPDRIIAAAHELGELKDQLATEPLVMVFNNQSLSPAARLAAAEALLQLETPPVEVTLLGALRNTDWHIRRNAAAILAQLRADWAVEPLGKILNDDHDLVRRTARAALKFIATPEALHILKSSAPAQTPAEEEADQALVQVSSRPTDSAPPAPTPPAETTPQVGKWRASKEALRDALFSAPRPEKMPPRPTTPSPAPDAAPQSDSTASAPPASTPPAQSSATPGEPSENPA